jgi:hypothetical protein
MFLHLLPSSGCIIGTNKPRTLPRKYLLSRIGRIGPESNCEFPPQPTIWFTFEVVARLRFGSLLMVISQLYPTPQRSPSENSDRDGEVPSPSTVPVTRRSKYRKSSARQLTSGRKQAPRDGYEADVITAIHENI